MEHLTSPNRSTFRGGIGRWILCVFVGSGCGIVGGTDESDGGDDCSVGEERCACYDNDTCDAGLTCFSGVCVEPDSITASGGGATTGENTSSSSSASSSSTGSGSTTSTSSGANTTQPTGSGSSTSTGGTSAGGTSTGDSPIIDAFSTCDSYIDTYSGRTGYWYGFGDSDINVTLGFGDPGSSWADHSCAAYLLLGCEVGGTACAHGGIGFTLLSSGGVYDLSGYTGVSAEFEGGDDVYFVVKTSGGGYFGTWLAGTTGNQVRNASFASLDVMAGSGVSSLDLALVTEIQFTVGTALASGGGFGVAIHNISLY